MKRNLAKILVLVLLLSLMVPAMVSAATQYKVTVTVSGPDKAGNSTSVTSNVVTVNDTDNLIATILGLASSPTIEEAFAGTGLRANFKDLETAADGGDWTSMYSSVAASTSPSGVDAIVSDSSSTIGDLAALTLTASASNSEMFKYDGQYYTVGITLEEYNPGESGEDIEPFFPSSGSQGQKKLPFVDVPEGDEIYDAIKWAYEAQPQVTTGVDATHFNPDGIVKRCEAVAFLWRAMGCPEPTSSENPFVDVRTTDYYYKAVLWGVEKGIIFGTDETHFSPNMTCATAHIITFLYRAANPGADGWYQEAAAWAENLGLLKNVDLEVSPKVDCPRAYVVLFLYRQIGKK